MMSMGLISIRERAASADGYDVTLSFDHGPEYQARVSSPFSEQDEALLEWYFEDHLRLPFVKQVDAKKAAASIRFYGVSLFEQLFRDRNAYARYLQALQVGPEALRIEIAGSLEFHQLHWEVLWDPQLPRPLSLDAVLLRKNLLPPQILSIPRESATLNLLVVTARPDDDRDVSYRTISRPLVETLHNAHLPVHVSILRPSTYEALSKHLDQVRAKHGSGHYHAIHFDTHGALLTHDQLTKAHQADPYLSQQRYGRSDIQRYEGFKAFLFLDGGVDGRADPIEAAELANLLTLHAVPLVILNACQSGKQVGASETSLGSRLMQAGMQMVLAMGYSVTVSAARLMIQVLYRDLFDGRPLADAIRRARRELHDRKGRKAYFNQVVDLEDWLLPVVYQTSELRFSLRELTPQEVVRRYERVLHPEPRPRYGFHGRDLDILRIERRLLFRRNLLLLRGMGGSGKTTLLHHLGAWWQRTDFVRDVFYFGYDQQAWTCQQILMAVAERLQVPRGLLQPLSLQAQRRLVTEKLRADRHLLILDNLESITGEHLAIGNTLSQPERQELKALLAELVGGQTLVILGSRGGEGWLAEGAFDDNVHDLEGLDPEAVSALAERALEKHGAELYRKDTDLETLLKVLGGYPLALEVVLANLSRKAPGEVLAALQEGNATLTQTERIVRCIDYSYGNLSEEARGLLLCLALFTSVIYEPLLKQYSELLLAQSSLGHLLIEKWPEVLREASNWGLMVQHQVSGYMSLQPVFPYFLRMQINMPARAAQQQAMETAFREVYAQFGRELTALFHSGESVDVHLASAIIGLEYENFLTALDSALKAQASITGIFRALSCYVDACHDHTRGIKLAEMVLTGLRNYGDDKLAGPLGVEILSPLVYAAGCYSSLKRPAKAETAFREASMLVQKQASMPPDMKSRWTARIFQGLGSVAQDLRKWDQAEDFYHKALAIYVQLENRYQQAHTYHMLGTLAQELGEWDKAMDYYLEASSVEIKTEDSIIRISMTESEPEVSGKPASTYSLLGSGAQLHHKVLSTYGEYKDRYQQASTYHYFGMAMQNGGKWDQAEDYYHKALAIFIEFKDRYQQADTYHKLGMVAQEQCKWDQASDYYHKALALFVEFGDRRKQASTYHYLGIVATMQKQWAAARHNLLRALAIAFEAEDVDVEETAIVMHSLAVLGQANQDDSLTAAIGEIVDRSAEEIGEALQKILQAAQPPDTQGSPPIHDETGE